jgi:hypothetical protein
MGSLVALQRYTRAGADFHRPKIVSSALHSQAVEPGDVARAGGRGDIAVTGAQVPRHLLGLCSRTSGTSPW